jgi:hypothetical protein
MGCKMSVADNADRRGFSRFGFLVLLFGLMLVGCQLGIETEMNPASANLGEVFTVAAGEEATINGENLRLRFVEVLEDSRCPTEVNCAWTGQARIAITVQQGEGEPVTVAFNTNPAPDQNQQTAVVGAYTIELQSLEPYPQTTAAIPFEEYRATLVVRKGAPVSTAAATTAAPSSFNLDEPFVLNGGQEVTISEENLRVRFDEVLDDSRCPTQVTCVWEGQARIALTVQAADGEPVEVELNSNGQVGGTTAEVDDYTIELQSLAPQPEQPDVAIPFEAYQATLVVTKGTTPSTEPVEANLEESFTLNGGQEATIAGENLRVRFAEVLEDSRCPRQVECEWGGQARVALAVQQGEADPVMVELNTYPYAGQQTAEVGPYTIQLRSIDPYPETAEETIPFETYWVMVVVWKERPVAYGLGEAFTMGGGEAVGIIGENLSLRFAEVLEDSRCPTEVECVWAGQARIGLMVQAGEGEPVEVELNSTVEEEQTAEVGGYRIELLLVMPERVRPEGVIGFEEYRVTLVVTR